MSNNQETIQLLNQELGSLERQVNQLLQLCTELKKTNHTLLESKHQLINDVTVLRQRNAVASQRIEMLLEKLKTANLQRTE